MTKHRFAKRLACASVIAAGFAISPAPAQQAEPAKPAEAAPKVAKPINTGDVLSGELTAMRVRGGGKKRVATYQITSEPRRLPPPNGLCNLETGPETFQLDHLERFAGRGTEALGRQGNLGEGRRNLLRAGRGPDDGSRRHQMERGEALNPYRPQRIEMSALLQPRQQDETRDRDQHADHEEPLPADGFRGIARA